MKTEDAPNPEYLIDYEKGRIRFLTPLTAPAAAKQKQRNLILILLAAVVIAPLLLLGGLFEGPMS